MSGNICFVCKSTSRNEQQLSFYRIPSDSDKRALWLRVLNISDHLLKPHYRVCSKHFRDGDPNNGPELFLGMKFATVVKRKDARTTRKMMRQKRKDLQALLAAPSSSKMESNQLLTLPQPSTIVPIVDDLFAHPLQPSLDVNNDVSATESTSGYSSIVDKEPIPDALSVTTVVHKLPHNSLQLPLSSADHECPSAPILVDEELEEQSPISHVSPIADNEQHKLNTALIAQLEVLEAENAKLKNTMFKGAKLTVDELKDDDRLFSFYTGFKSYQIFLAFYEFLGPAVNMLNYWGSKKTTHQRKKATKLKPIDQLLMTLMKLRLIFNLKTLDLSFRFGVSKSAVSRYIMTWICFLYNHLKEVDWMPSVQQVSATLPPAFRDKYPSTYAIIDGSEIFLETPSDLHMQSYTWSSYKHHNTAKFLIACTPNGCISYISTLYVGSISDLELTNASGFLTKLKDKPGISIMADRGFNIEDLLQKIDVGFNIPPFLNGKQQFSADEVQEGRRIASSRIIVERAIGRIKSFTILKHTLPISLSRISNQIVYVCAFLTNFKPVLVPSESNGSMNEVEKYFENIDSEESNEEYSESDFDE